MTHPPGQLEGTAVFMTKEKKVVEKGKKGGFRAGAKLSQKAVTARPGRPALSHCCRESQTVGLGLGVLSVPAKIKDGAPGELKT